MLLLVGPSMIRGFKVVTEWITPQTVSRRSPEVDTLKLGSNGGRPRSADPGGRPTPFHRQMAPAFSGSILGGPLVVSLVYA
jgi:hypothetical protein